MTTQTPKYMPIPLISAPQHKVLTSLIRLLDSPTLLLCPSRRELANDVGVSETSVSKSLAILQLKGLVECKPGGNRAIHATRRGRVAASRKPVGIIEARFQHVASVKHGSAS